MGLGPFQSRALVIASEAIPDFTEIALGLRPSQWLCKGLVRRDSESPHLDMYDSVASFLKNFSANFPLLWALLVMVVIAGAGLALYAFWELLLRVVTIVFSSSARKR
jgi:hypothetical protein